MLVYSNALRDVDGAECEKCNRMWCTGPYISIPYGYNGDVKTPNVVVSVCVCSFEEKEDAISQQPIIASSKERVEAHTSYLFGRAAELTKPTFTLNAFQAQFVKVTNYYIEWFPNVKIPLDMQMSGAGILKFVGSTVELSTGWQRVVAVRNVGARWSDVGIALLSDGSQVPLRVVADNAYTGSVDKWSEKGYRWNDLKKDLEYLAYDLQISSNTYQPMLFISMYTPLKICFLRRRYHIALDIDGEVPELWNPNLKLYFPDNSSAYINYTVLDAMVCVAQACAGDAWHDPMQCRLYMAAMCSKQVPEVSEAVNSAFRVWRKEDAAHRCLVSVWYFWHLRPRMLTEQSPEMKENAMLPWLWPQQESDSEPCTQEKLELYLRLLVKYVFKKSEVSFEIMTLLFIELITKQPPLTQLPLRTGNTMRHLCILLSAVDPFTLADATYGEASKAMRKAT